MLKISNLSKKYNKSDKYAVENLSFEVKDGEILGFLGPNGAGKSTTIKCIMGILPFSEGSVEVNGVNLKDSPIEAKKFMGYVPDNHAVYDKLTGNEYIDFMANIYGVPTDIREERKRKYADIFDLANAMNNPIKSYSHGMKQKICVIGALIHEPKLWVLDEPLTGLDPKSAYLLKELMKEHCKKGNSVFFSSHVLEVVEKVCDRVAIIDNGKLLAIASIDELKENRKELSLEDFFLNITGSSSEIDEVLKENGDMFEKKEV